MTGFLATLRAALGAAVLFAAAAIAQTASDDGTPDAHPESPSFDTEQVIAAQPALLAEKLAQLAPQRPGQVDVYFVAFGGDGDEDVFRNEAEYAQKLFDQRFGAAGRTLALVNHTETIGVAPLATRTNLTQALAAIGRIIDRDEDIVVLFMTSHGNHDDHSVYVKLGELPLYDVTPADLRKALDRAGIKHRVVVVSACYAGGFVRPLRDGHTMVITAARADRPSFGCSSESELTYFGHAFLVDALNRTVDFREAFAQARGEIAEWENEQDQKHSYPQFASAPAIDRQLARWRAQLHAGFPVPFRPARESADSLLAPSPAGTSFVPPAPSTENR